MICRARPRYLRPEDIPSALSGGGGNPPGAADAAVENDFYFNTGGLAFEFFLRCYNAFYKKAARVAIQSFTCRTMLEAIVRSGSTAYIFDVKLEDASLSFSQVEGEGVDIIVLTSYQGVPNQEYLKFSAYCRERGIFLFDDLSHGTLSRVDGVKAGSLSGAYIESYTFDKPCSALSGGKLVLSPQADPAFARHVRGEYGKLPCEPETAARRDLQTLSFLMRYTLPENYFEDFDYRIFVQCRPFIRLWNRRLFRAEPYRKALLLAFKAIRRLSGPQARPGCMRMAEEKKRCAALQSARYLRQRGKQPDYRALLGAGRENCFERPNAEIVWNRYSVIDADGSLEKRLRLQGLCAGHYNWPSGLHDHADKYEKGRVVLRPEGYPNTEYLKTHILNIPVWQFDPAFTADGKGEAQ